MSRLLTRAFIGPHGSCVLRRSHTWMRIRIPGQVEKKAAKMLKAEGCYGPKTTVYYIEFRVRRLREKGQPENARTEDRNVQTCLSDRRIIDAEHIRPSRTANEINADSTTKSFGLVGIGSVGSAGWAPVAEACRKPRSLQLLARHSKRC